jgi:hypothetical protein
MLNGQLRFPFRQAILALALDQKGIIFMHREPPAAENRLQMR